jgi:hypothetical protein
MLLRGDSTKNWRLLAAGASFLLHGALAVAWVQQSQRPAHVDASKKSVTSIRLIAASVINSDVVWPGPRAVKVADFKARTVPQIKTVPTLAPVARVIKPIDPAQATPQQLSYEPEFALLTTQAPEAVVTLKTPLHLPDNLFKTSTDVIQAKIWLDDDSMAKDIEILTPIDDPQSLWTLIYYLQRAQYECQGRSGVLTIIRGDFSPIIPGSEAPENREFQARPS